jgi:antitoxin component of MazEF toxin-antitoxin module
MEVLSTATVRRVGRTVGIVLPSPVTERLSLTPGDTLLVLEVDDGLFVTPPDAIFEQAFRDYQESGRAFHEALTNLSG